MRKLHNVIKTLENIEEGNAIYDLTDAAWIRRFKAIRPDCVVITLNPTHNRQQPIFHAALTPRGKQYLQELRQESEITRLR